MTPPNEHPRLIVVSNRLPVRRIEEGGSPRWEMSPGGLVTALRPLLQRTQGAWVGWAGTEGPDPLHFTHDGIENHALPLAPEDIDEFYLGFSNETLWPLYHDAVRAPEYHRSWWARYRDVNERYAHLASEAIRDGDQVWVHDYQLQLVPGYLRKRSPGTPIGYFNHIPFPPVELFAQLPWRTHILEGLLGADVVGFQTKGGAQNFLRAVRRFTEASVSGNTVRWEGRSIRVDAYPISIDVESMEALAQQDSVRERTRTLREQVGDHRKVFLGVDRLDYTKGIDIRLRAFAGLLERLGSRARDVTFIQIAVPSRESVGPYADLRTTIEQQVGRINGDFGDAGHSPVTYLYRSLPMEELISYYRAADVMVVTPLRDGMNLVAKEYVAARIENDGAMILSEFTGAARELRSAHLVNPHDIDGLIDAMQNALDQPEEARRRRMGSMRRAVTRNDVHRWADSFLSELSKA